MHTRRETVLETVVDLIRKQWGADALGRLPADNLSRLPTGYAALDEIAGGGIPAGHISELAGTPTCGMTTLALRLVAETQTGGGAAVLLDPDRAFAPDYAARCGVDLDHLLLIRPHQAAEGLEILGDLARQGGADLALIAPALEPLRAPDGAWQKLALRVAGSGLAVVALAPGGLDARPNRSHVALRLLVERLGWVRAGGDVLGCHSRVTVVKHKLGPAGGMVTLALTPQEGTQR